MGTRVAAQIVGGRYKLEKVLGRGGMGVVWQARHTALNAPFAIKFLHAHSAQEEATRKRFLTEAQVTAQLKTRHAVSVFDFGVTDDGQPYLVMEMLVGESLGERLRKAGSIGVQKTLKLLRQAARALDRAHAAGIVHRDFKPENMFICVDEEGNEELKVMDFGVAKLVGELEAPAPPEVLGKEALSTFTRTGALLGTPYYMAPEQIRATGVGPAADVWAFGVVCFECLTGQVPFDGKNLSDLFARITARNYPLPRSIDPDLPPAFEAWFEKACATDPDARFASATEAWNALAAAFGKNEQIESAATNERPTAKPPPSAIETLSDEIAPAPVESPKPWTRSINRPPRTRKPLVVGGATAAIVAIAVVLGTTQKKPAPPPPAPAIAPSTVAIVAPPPAPEPGTSASAPAPPATSAAPTHEPKRAPPPPRPAPPPASAAATASAPAPKPSAEPPPPPPPSSSAPSQSSPFKLPDLGL